MGTGGVTFDVLHAYIVIQHGLAFLIVIKGWRIISNCMSNKLGRVINEFFQGNCVLLWVVLVTTFLCKYQSLDSYI